MPTTAPPDNALSQLQVMEAEQVHALIKHQQALGYVMQAEKFSVTAIKVVVRLKFDNKNCLSKTRLAQNEGRCAGRA